ncbi:sialin-like isoform X2 [Gigantopelta aegis]|nr:sialin-like isoform X2 [Gigantopelta aegis]
MRMLGVTLTGGEIGNALSFPIGGVLCKYGFDGGWPSMFYATGAAGLLWIIGWAILVRDHPQDVPGISEKERKYLESVINRQAMSHKSQKTPWLQLLTSRPCVALMVTHFTANFFNYMMLTQIPTYMKEVMNFDISANGFFSMLPYIGLCIMINVASTTSDCLITRKCLNVAQTRKLMNTLGMVLPGVFMLFLAQLDSQQQTLGVALLCGAVASFGFCFSGHITNFADIAVVHAGTLAGVSNTFATIPGILAPYVVARMTKHGTRGEWQLVFYCATGILFLGTFVFLLFGSGMPQSWALPANANKTTYIGAGPDTEYSGIPNCDLKLAVLPKSTDVECKLEHSRILGSSLKPSCKSAEERKSMLCSSNEHTDNALGTKGNTDFLVLRKENTDSLRSKEEDIDIPESNEEQTPMIGSNMEETCVLEENQEHVNVPRTTLEEKSC